MKTFAFRFSASLGLALALVGIASAQSDELDAQIAGFTKDWQVEQAAIDKISELGGWVVVEECIPDEIARHLDEEKRAFVVEVNMVFHKENGVRSENQNLSADALQHIANFSQLKRVMLCKTQANDDELVHLAGLGNLEAIYIWDGSEVSDAGLKHFEKLDKLKILHLSQSKITDKGIESICHLPNLEKLSLQKNAFTDDVFKFAGQCRSLKSLWVGLGESRMTDEGLSYLHMSTTLEILEVQRCGISDEAVTLLKSSVPTLKWVLPTDNEEFQRR